MDESVEEREPKRAARLLRGVLDAVVADARREASERTGEAARRLRDGHVVVVEDHDYPARRRCAVVERLEAGAVRNRGVAYHRHDVLVRPLPVARRGETLRDGKRDARVPRDRGVRLRLLRIRKARYTAHLPERRKLVPASGEQLPRVRLVPYVPHDAVSFRIEHLAERHRYLHGAERGREVSAVLRNGLENPLPDFKRVHFASALRLRTSSVVAF